MFDVTAKETLAAKISRIRVAAPDIAKRAAAGQFVVLRVNDRGERIPLTIADSDPVRGTIDLIFQEIGATTTMLGRLNPGDRILDLVGPLGHPTRIEHYGTVVAVAGGVGAAEILPVVKALKAAGNKVISVIGARSKDFLILVKELSEAGDKLVIMTDDGTAGQKGFVTNALEDLIARRVHIDLVYAIGPVPMMKAVAGVTRNNALRTVVSLNPIMVDGTGMCGSCRVSIDGKTLFACVDGPEFDAHKVNWDELIQRLSLFKHEEKRSLENISGEHPCRKQSK